MVRFLHFGEEDLESNRGFEWEMLLCVYSTRGCNNLSPLCLIVLGKRCYVRELHTTTTNDRRQTTRCEELGATYLIPSSVHELARPETRPWPCNQRSSWIRGRGPAFAWPLLPAHLRDPPGRSLKSKYPTTFYPLRRESRWSKDHDKLPRSASAPMNGSEEAGGGGTKGSIEQK